MTEKIFTQQRGKFPPCLDVFYHATGCNGYSFSAQAPDGMAMGFEGSRTGVSAGYFFVSSGQPGEKRCFSSVTQGDIRLMNHHKILRKACSPKTDTAGCFESSIFYEALLRKYSADINQCRINGSPFVPRLVDTCNSSLVFGGILGNLMAF